MSTDTETIEQLATKDYKYGFVTPIESDTLPPGLSEDTVREISRLKGEHTRLTEDNGKLQREVTALQERVSQAETTGSEVSALKEERDLIRARVGEILAELDTLKL